MGIFYFFFEQPFFNLLVFFSTIFNNNYLWVGLLISIFIVKILLFKLNKNLITTQAKIHKIQPSLISLKDNKKLSKEEMASKTIALYKENGVNPFYPIFVLAVQVPIFLGIFFVLRGLSIGEFDVKNSLYSFLPNFDFNQISHQFFSIDLYASGGIVFALLVALTQILYLTETQKNVPKEQIKTQKNIGFFITLIAGIASFAFSAVLGFYWATNNLLSYIIEKALLKKVRKELAD